MKRIRILVEGNPKPYKLQIGPNTSVRDLFAHLSLEEGYTLYSLSDPQRHFTSEEALYDYVKNNEKFIARARVKLDYEKASQELESLIVVDED